MQGIERTGADIAINDSQRAEDEPSERGFMAVPGFGHDG
jgi:hypothetical protein